MRRHLIISSEIKNRFRNFCSIRGFVISDSINYPKPNPSHPKLPGKILRGIYYSWENLFNRPFFIFFSWPIRAEFTYAIDNTFFWERNEHYILVYII